MINRHIFWNSIHLTVKMLPLPLFLVAAFFPSSLLVQKAPHDWQSSAIGEDVHLHRGSLVIHKPYNFQIGIFKNLHSNF